jgi:hypothetical protein
MIVKNEFERYGRNRPWLNLRNYPGMYMEGKPLNTLATVADLQTRV